jgi:hypothetical protein
MGVDRIDTAYCLLSGIPKIANNFLQIERTRIALKTAIGCWVGVTRSKECLIKRY